MYSESQPWNTNVSQSNNAEVQSKIRSKLAAWDTLATYRNHALFKFGTELKAILDETDYDEMYGVKLVAPEEG